MTRALALMLAPAALMLPVLIAAGWRELVWQPMALRVLRGGATRVVILAWGWAFKLPSIGLPGNGMRLRWQSFLRGLLANIQEAEFAAAGWPELCPVVAHIPGGFLNVMPRAEPLSRDQWFALCPATLIDRGDYVIPAELKLDSFGWIAGPDGRRRIVAVDYGGDI